MADKRQAGKKRAEKQRLDVLLCERGLVASRELARRMILAGEVRVEGVLRDIPSMQFAPTLTIVVQGAGPYVSRGGHKLAHALDRAKLDVTGMIAVDIGASTGLATNGHAQVLGDNDQPITGLYAVGNDMHSIMGGVYTAPGITIGPGLPKAIRAMISSNRVGFASRSRL